MTGSYADFPTLRGIKLVKQDLRHETRRLMIRFFLLHNLCSFFFVFLNECKCALEGFRMYTTYDLQEETPLTG